MILQRTLKNDEPHHKPLSRISVQWVLIRTWTSRWTEWKWNKLIQGSRAWTLYSKVCAVAFTLKLMTAADCILGTVEHRVLHSNYPLFYTRWQIPQSPCGSSCWGPATSNAPTEIYLSKHSNLNNCKKKQKNTIKLMYL